MPNLGCPLSFAVKATFDPELIMKSQPEKTYFQNINFQSWLHERDKI